MHRLFLVLISAVCLAVSALAQSATPPAAAKFGPQWHLLVGEWAGEASSGSGAGYCAFRFELGEHILVRTNHAEITGRSAAHDDLMVISPGPGEGQAQASYWDNEGHRIEYSASWSSDGTTLTFLSKPGTGPQFRLTYKKLDADNLTVNFEMAPPGQAGTFRPYTSGKIRKLK